MAKDAGKGGVIAVDFTGVESGGAPSVHIPEGDYGFKIQKVVQKKGKDSGEPYLLFSLKVTKGHPKGIGKVVPHNCSLQTKSLWNLRNLIEATGKEVPSKSLKLNLDNMPTWPELAGTVIDDEYNGKKKSVISAFFPVADLSTAPPKGDAEGEESGAESPADEPNEEEEELFG